MKPSYRWSNKAPTEKSLGYYWFRWSPSHEPSVIKVFVDEDDDILSVRTGDGIDDVNFLHNYAIGGSEWAGPILEPL